MCMTSAGGKGEGEQKFGDLSAKTKLVANMWEGWGKWDEGTHLQKKI